MYVSDWRGKRRNQAREWRGEKGADYLSLPPQSHAGFASFFVFPPVIRPFFPTKGPIVPG